MDESKLKKTWEDLKLVSELERECEDDQGNITSTEGEALLKMKRKLQRELALEADKILEQAGFLKSAKKKGKKIPGL